MLTQFHSDAKYFTIAQALNIEEIKCTFFKDKFKNYFKLYNPYAIATEQWAVHINLLFHEIIKLLIYSKINILQF